MVAHIIPGPAVESAFLHPGDVIGDQIVAQGIALVGRDPEVAGGGVDRQADPVADAGGEGVERLGALGIGDEDVGPVGLGVPGGAVPVRGLPLGDLVAALLAHPFGDVRARTDRDEHPLSVEGKGDVAGAVAAAAIGQMGDDHLGRRARLEIAAVIGEADHRVVVGHVDPLRIVARRVEGDAEGAVEVVGEDLVLGGGIGPVGGAQDPDPVGAGLGDEDIAVRRHPQHAGIRKARGEEPDGESRGHRQGRAVRLLHHLGAVPRRRGTIRRREVGHQEMVFHARSGVVPIVGVRWRRDGGRRRRGESAHRRGQCRQIGDDVAAIPGIGDGDRHGRSRDQGRRSGQEAVEGGGVPVQLGADHRLGVTESRARSGGASQDADQAGALFHDGGVARSQGVGMADGAVLLEVGFATDRIAGLAILSQCPIPCAESGGQA